MREPRDPNDHRVRELTIAEELQRARLAADLVDGVVEVREVGDLRDGSKPTSEAPWATPRMVVRPAACRSSGSGRTGPGGSARRTPPLATDVLPEADQPRRRIISSCSASLMRAPRVRRVGAFALSGSRERRQRRAPRRGSPPSRLPSRRRAPPAPGLMTSAALRAAGGGAPPRPGAHSIARRPDDLLQLLGRRGATLHQSPGVASKGSRASASSISSCDMYADRTSLPAWPQSRWHRRRGNVGCRVVRQVWIARRPCPTSPRARRGLEVPQVLEPREKSRINAGASRR